MQVDSNYLIDFLPKSSTRGKSLSLFVIETARAFSLVGETGGLARHYSCPLLLWRSGGCPAFLHFLLKRIAKSRNSKALKISGHISRILSPKPSSVPPREYERPYAAVLIKQGGNELSSLL
jgi:hypothetical protein